jgi:hypothetical protein
LDRTAEQPDRAGPLSARSAIKRHRNSTSPGVRGGTWVSLRTVIGTVKGPSRAGSIFFGENTEGITGGKSLPGSGNRGGWGSWVPVFTYEVSASPLTLRRMPRQRNSGRATRFSSLPLTYSSSCGEQTGMVSVLVSVAVSVGFSFPSAAVRHDAPGKATKGP